MWCVRMIMMPKNSPANVKALSGEEAVCTFGQSVNCSLKAKGKDLPQDLGDNSYDRDRLAFRVETPASALLIFVNAHTHTLRPLHAVGTCLRSLE